MHNICFISDTRSGSTAISDVLARSLKIRDMGEIFYPVPSDYCDFDGADVNYYLSYSVHGGDLFSYLDWLYKNNDGGMVAKVMYHDFVIGLKHPGRLDYTFPLSSVLPHAFNAVVHLKRKNLMHSALSGILAASSNVFHKRIQDGSNVDSKCGKPSKVFVDLDYLEREIESRRCFGQIMDKAVAKISIEQKIEIYYEDFFSEAGGLELFRHLFSDVDSTVELGFNKVNDKLEDRIANYDELFDRFQLFL